MKIAIATVQIPFIKGGAEYLASNLLKELTERGYEADIITMPFKWYPASSIMDSILSARMIDLTEVNGVKIDKLIALKFPMYYVQHEHKVTWMLHQHRQAYELWGTEYGDLDKMEDGPRVRDIIVKNDCKFLAESKGLYTISNTVTDRLKKYNGLNSIPLYHPPSNHKEFYCDNFEDYIFYPGRITEIKRQHILIESLKYCSENIKVVLAGSIDESYRPKVQSIIKENGLENRVIFAGFITEEEKRRYYSNALAIYNGPYQEDYGYVTLEAFFALKPVLTHYDSGGPLEFVKNEHTGYITDDHPEKLAEKIDLLYNNKNKARELGLNGNRLLEDLKVDWNYVIERLIT
ncbi:glycosyltransferase family 4 protein [Paenibacillus sonchi]|uniref:Glycosyltransferase family 4 protein n=1 Tax=Paenibacillus sonchi TaxID=373687 RepID=A0A974PE39_9BACL|nr:glycosyltransferase family 4 protein [Paenibacillus sonchi]QQZ62145.1 glycosyltransferase family 4 protein [Paenibacillus sonchi]